MTRIRVATNLDREIIREVHLSAFSEGERQIVSMLAINLLSEQTNPETFSLVGEIDGAVVGHIAFSPVTVVFVYGDPKYYGKFGFEVDAASRYTPPYKLQYPFGWQAVTLNDAGLAKSSAKVSCVASLCDPELW